MLWRKTPTMIAALLFAVSLGSGWHGLTSSDSRLLLVGVTAFVSAFLYLILLELKRLTSDWPPGIIFTAGADAERRRRRRRARRGSHDLVSVDGASR